MSYPWAAGEVLTASDLNNYAGLVLIKTQTIGATVASVTVTDVFSSTFDSYKIIWRVADSTSVANVLFQLGSATTNYRFAFTAIRFSTATYSTGSTTGTSFYAGAVAGSTNAGSGFIEVHGPNLAENTHCHLMNDYGLATTGWIGYGGGIQTDTTQFTDFVLSVSAGTMTGGTIKVYGYNNG